MGTKYEVHWNNGAQIVSSYATNNLLDAVWQLYFKSVPGNWYWRSLEVR